MLNYDYELKDDFDISPLPDHVLVYGMEGGEVKLKSGLIVPDDDGKERGIRPRKCFVYAVGTNVLDVKPDDQILVAHGRWTRGIKVKQQDGEIKIVRRVDTKDILLAF